YDIYAPVAGREKKYSYSEGTKLVLDCYKDFSPETARLALRVLSEKHIDSVVDDGKMSGAFCYGVTPNITPYVLVNYTGKERDVMTLAHELGHAIHDLLSSKNSILMFHPPLILAETASIFGEMIVTEKLLGDARSRKEKTALLTSKLDDIYASIIRKAFFVMFEQDAHKAADEGATVDELSGIYLKNLKEQFGNSVKISDDFRSEWMYIPHIYHTPFYCYAYSFGNLLTLALYKMYKEQGKKFVPKYLKFLSYGGSKKPAKIGKELGINFEDARFWQKGFDMVKDMIDGLEKTSKN
ncbi:MAG: M3 family metallopeptidase, partial [Nanoarchaeota archaeon]